MDIKYLLSLYFSFGKKRIKRLTFFLSMLPLLVAFLVLESLSILLGFDYDEGPTQQYVIGFFILCTFSLSLAPLTKRVRDAGNSLPFFLSAYSLFQLFLVGTFFVGDLIQRPEEFFVLMALQVILLFITHGFLFYFFFKKSQPVLTQQIVEEDSEIEI